jgi:hypothetical protein
MKMAARHCQSKAGQADRAKIKTDLIDTAVLAKLYATGFLPEVWFPAEATLAL